MLIFKEQFESSEYVYIIHWTFLFLCFLSYPVLWSVWPAPGSAWCWADCTAGPERCSSLPWLWCTGLCSPVQVCNGVCRRHRPDSATSSSLLHQLPAGHEIWRHSSALTVCPLETLRSYHHHQHPCLKSKSQIKHMCSSLPQAPFRCPQSWNRQGTHPLQPASALLWSDTAASTADRARDRAASITTVPLSDSAAERSRNRWGQKQVHPSKQPTQSKSKENIKSRYKEEIWDIYPQVEQKIVLIWCLCELEKMNAIFLFQQ